ncbi:MAG: thiamine phosphate synthase [Actinomycetota bacterium]|nr:thiamine phosphate synthase [Actinomycetota bacterium]MDA8279545.1 thiamine phosphate synthase [Actinomycetota bacterium]MDA8343053.1 thiamine phosphate synthase [Actinomycetota bacterium]
MTAGDLAGRRLYLCTPDRPDLEHFVEHCILGGVDVVQLRERSLGDRALVARARALVAVCAAHGVPAIVNDRPDLAIAAGADGVHVGQDDIEPAVARTIVGPDRIVGLSTHAPDELAGSLAEPVDYISAGPVNATPTKPGRPGTGTGYLHLAVQRSPRPVFVTGGVTPDIVGELAAVGARHFVVVRYLTESDDPRAAARRLRAAIDDAVEQAEPGT